VDITTQIPPIHDWESSTIKATNYWDCSGQSCDAKTLQPWDHTKYLASHGYGPQDPEQHGGAWYGEKMWVTGAASDMLAAILGPDDGCCGEDGDGKGGCGKCLLIQNSDAVNSDWTAVIMKKNRCPPWSSGCNSMTEGHFDLAVPGFDNLQFSTANICGNPGTGMTKHQSANVGGNGVHKWDDECQNTAQCAHLCDVLPNKFIDGCKLFASWGWRKIPGQPVYPQPLRWKRVDCPSRFVEHVNRLFDAQGLTEGGRNE